MNFPVVGDQLLVYDPASVGAGKVEWRSLTDWYLMGSTRDTGSGVETVFLYVPDSF